MLLNYKPSRPYLVNSRKAACNAPHQLPNRHESGTHMLRRMKQRCRTRALSPGQRTRVSSEEGFIFGSKGYVAGIPTSPSTTECGQRLRACLKHRPHEFVPLVMSEIQGAFNRVSGRGRAAQRKGSSGATQQSILEDIVFWWMLAEAYVQHPALQADMRAALEGTPPSTQKTQSSRRHWLQYERTARPGALAAGKDRMRLQSRVQILDNEYEGYYMIGSVRFVRDAPVNGPTSGRLGSAGSPQQAVFWGGSDSNAADRSFSFDDFPLDALLGRSAAESEALPKPLVPMEADTPSRMSRQGAARTYHTYLSWGYFQRRMAQQRETASAALSSSSSSSPVDAGKAGSSSSTEDGGGTEGTSQRGLSASTDLPQSSAGGPSSSASYAGDACQVWRYFESVPEEMSTMRTLEAAAAADRHLRALFGTEEECITSLAAWQHMCTEARWVGRALFDAEEMVLRYTQ